MAGHTRQQIEVAKQFRKALALDLVSEGAPAAYELLKLTVKGALERLRITETDGSCSNQSLVEMGGRLARKSISREELDAAKTLLTMSGLSERVVESEQGVALAKLSLAELEAMIRDLKVIEHAPNAAQPAHADTQDLDIFK